MKKHQKPDLATPAIDHPDTLAALLKSLGPENLEKFPETVSYLEGMSAVQQAEMQYRHTLVSFQEIVYRALQAFDPSSPASIGALNDMLDTAIYDRGLTDLSAESRARMEQKVAVFLDGSSITAQPTTQASLPEVLGLPELVEFFKEQAQSRMQKQLAKIPTPGSRDFVPACLDLCDTAGTFSALLKWENGEAIHNVFGMGGVANQATNILRTIVNNSDSTYPASIGFATFDGLVEKIKKEKVKTAATHALHALSPEDRLRAVDLLHQDNAAEAPAGTRKHPSPR